MQPECRKMQTFIPQAMLWIMDDNVNEYSALKDTAELSPWSFLRINDLCPVTFTVLTAPIASRKLQSRKGDFFGEEEKKLMVVIVWWLGLKLLGQLNLEGLVSHIFRIWDGHCGCVGYGYKKIEPDRPWAAFPIQVHPSVKAFFSMAVISEVGNGKNTFFWTDKWLHGQSLALLVPHLFRVVSSRAKKRTVFEALTEMKWISDVRGASTVAELSEYLYLWDLLSYFVLQPEVEDSHTWQLSSSGKYSAKAAYEGLFIGAIQFSPWERIWKNWAPGKCKFFMWLVAHNKCWTADRLARRGLPHPEYCPLCDQAEETIDHLLVSCVFAREVWFIILQFFGLQPLTPQPDCTSFNDRWESSVSRVDGQIKKGLNSIIILVAWSIWKHRNRCVFDGISPNLNGALLLIREEILLWSLAGARGISHLLALGVIVDF